MITFSLVRRISGCLLCRVVPGVQMAAPRRGRGGGRSSRPLRVLVDMDCVLCDFEGKALKIFRETYPQEPYIPLDKRRTFYLRDQYISELGRQDLGDKIREILFKPGFFRNLPPIDGGIEAVKEMSGIENVEVFLCTSPVHLSLTSASEKYEWVEEYMGKDWIGRMIIATDKTMVQGDVLIDDRPSITGSMRPPSWDHVLFSAPHNMHIDVSTLRCVSRLDGWNNAADWKSLIQQYQKKVMK